MLKPWWLVVIHHLTVTVGYSDTIVPYTATQLLLYFRGA